ncbi:GNAT family N-acetyltransferase [Amycolatopsis suaedae]|uniref:GNAT family N-acetyltransferase n=1 Tax=Amycolatopsis suaedae TaxID=2510978 RepID=A0A4Q7IYQ9_9PSEU|nr:GNAT family N-acetyltransferase [Amycolatopsis suaedae]RZQ60141.1 GNAT family N-acetyltransferase [Amycolatopsis suaedae]
MGVRVARDHDIEVLVASVSALFAEDGARRDRHLDVSWPDRHGRDYYRELLADPGCSCWLAVGDSGQVVGHLVGRLAKPDPLRPGAVTAVLESMRVAPACRGQRMGAALVAEFDRWARRSGATELTVTAYASNEAALAFYRGQGFAEFEVRLHRPGLSG